MEVGVVIARFQVPALTEAHKELLAHVCKVSDYTVVLLGVPAFRTHANPLTFAERADQVLEWHDQTNQPGVIECLPILDGPDDVVWSRHVDALINRTYPGHKVTLWGGRKSFIPHYHGKFKTVQFKGINEGTSGTETRATVAYRPITYSYDYRAGYVAAMEHQPAIVTPCVDIAYLNDLGDEVVMIRKHGEDKWRLPGGKVDPGETTAIAARRELWEETGISSETLKFVGEFVISDWRLRGTKHGVVTFFYTARGWMNTPEGRDDAAEAQWMKIATLGSGNVVTEHLDLISRLQGS